ncbi:MAG TPA: 30S ribosomal protein S5 [Candidatus Paceibacterota bacterium]|nr:30S ribosomal protein S5 [Candidatus Paceibacterota bacterium]
MSKNTQQEAIEGTPVPPSVAPEATTDAPAANVPRGRGRGRREGEGDNRRNPRRARRGGRREDRPRSEFEQKMISIRRVTRVMAGGRRFSFSVAIVIGDKKGRVGVGIGKAGDTQLAIEKAVRNARKNLITVPMNKHSHIPHDVHTKVASSEVKIIPSPGRGLVAGSSVRIVLELAGVKDVTAKIFSRSKNKLNNARAAVAALKMLKA